MQSLYRTSLVAGLAAAILALLAPAAFGQAKSEAVTFKSADGVTLSGTFYPAGGKKDKKTVVLYLHDFDHKNGGGAAKGKAPDLFKAAGRRRIRGAGVRLPRLRRQQGRQQGSLLGHPQVPLQHPAEHHAQGRQGARVDRPQGLQAGLLRLPGQRRRRRQGVPRPRQRPQGGQLLQRHRHRRRPRRYRRRHVGRQRVHPPQGQEQGQPLPQLRQPRGAGVQGHRRLYLARRPPQRSRAAVRRSRSGSSPRSRRTRST